MFLTEEQAKAGKCLLLVKQNDGFTRPAMVGNCLGSACVTYWKWSEADKSKGYCSKAGKPDF